MDIVPKHTMNLIHIFLTDEQYNFNTKDNLSRTQSKIFCTNLNLRGRV